MSDDIDDVQDPIYHMRRRTLFNLLMYYVRGCACTWMALRAQNPSPSGLITLNPQSTCYGPRPGPKLVCGVRAGSLRAMEPRARGKTPGRKRKNAEGPKEHIYIYVQGSPSGCVWREIPGVAQVEKGHAGNTAVATAYLCWVKHGRRSSRTGVPVDYYY